MITTKIRTMRVALVCTLLAAAACGDDDDGKRDAAPADAVVAPADAAVSDARDADASASDASAPGCACLGGCPSQPPDGQAEGGELRIELIQTGLAAEQVTAHALVFQGQIPPLRGLNGEIIHAGDQTFCSDMRTGDQLLSGRTIENQFIADTRTYWDMGSAFALEHDGAQILLSKQLDTLDPSVGLLHDIVYVGGQPGDFARDALYKPSVTGAVALDLRNGVSPSLEPWGLDEPAVYVPYDFTLLEPAANLFFAGLTLQPGQDFVFNWRDDAGPPTGVPTVLPFVILTNHVGANELVCLQIPTEPSPAERTLTLPSLVIDLASDTGTLTMGLLSYTAWELQCPYDRFDLIGITAKRTTYNKRAAPLTR